MGERILITGGAGFVGSHLADALLVAGHRVTALDNLEPQVHHRSGRPAYLHPDVELAIADVRDTDRVVPLLRRADVVIHLAALVGVGQSMYEIERFTSANTAGAASLLEALVRNRDSVRKLVVASSMSVYGEGAYECPRHGSVSPRLRTEAQLRRREWEVRCPTCDAALTPLPTGEDKPLFPTSIYAINKRDHEEMGLAIGHGYGIPTVALRFFNIYGSRQALSNPYTGVAAIFCSRLLNGRPPAIFEDGGQTRDFTHVSDIVQGCVLAIERPEADYGTFNLGTGRALSVRQLADALARELGWHGEPEIANQYRAGDIRHCYADITLARQRLGYEPRITFEEGLIELLLWVSNQSEVADYGSLAAAELVANGLTR